MPSTILVYDFETTGKDPNTCQPVQLAVLPIDYQTLTYNIKDAFLTSIRPDDFDNIDKEVMLFHSKNWKISESEIIDRWKAAPSLEDSWKNFLLYVKKWNPTGNQWHAGIRAGHNIIRYDDIIIERLSKQFPSKQKTIFHPRDYIDTMHLSFLWLESLSEPTSYSMEKLMEFHGFTLEEQSNAHDALHDCVNCAKLIIHYLKLHRMLAPKVGFKQAFAKKDA